VFALESANVVGYQVKNQVAGEMNWLVSTFDSVGEGGTLGDIKCNSVNFGSDVLQLLNPNGSTKQAFWYLDPATAAEAEMEPGWYDATKAAAEEYVCCNSIPLPYGQGFMFYAGNPDLTLTFAGQVDDKGAPFAMATGAMNFTGNATPSAITLGDVTCNSVNFGSDVLQLLAANGATKQAFWYLDPATAAEAEMEPGWYDATKAAVEEYECFNKIPLQAGDGFMFYAGNPGLELNIPSAL
jgi:hypothetical protein